MSTVLTKGGQVSCASSGTVSTVGKPRLKVADSAVLVLDGIQGKPVSGCTIVTNTQSGTKQCLTVSSASGVATKLKVDGAAVVLVESFTGSTDGSTPTLSASDSQTKLTAV